MDKKQLRAIKHQQRKVFPNDLKHVYDEKIRHEILNLVKDIECISVYISIKDEIDTRLLIKDLMDMGKSICVPTIQNDKLVMVNFNSISECSVGHMDLLEPINKIECLPQIVLVPMIAFNEKGYRIGYGKGYYDAYLNEHDIPTIGLAYSWMKEEFKPDKHDVSLDKIVTEKEIHSFT